MAYTPENYHKTVLFPLWRVDCDDGVASHLEVLIAGLSRHGWRVVIISGKVHSKEAARTRYNSIRDHAHAWVELDDTEGLMANLNFLRTILDAARRYGATVVHLHGLALLPHSRCLKLFRRIKVIVSYHPSTHSSRADGIPTRISTKSRIVHAIFVQTFRPDFIIAFSSEIYRFFLKTLLFPARRIVKIFLGIDTVYYRPPAEDERITARAVLGIKPDDVAIVLPGRLNWNKGHDLVFSAADIVRKSQLHKAVKYIFPGTGGQSEDIRNLANQGGNSSDFIIPGFVDDMRAIYHASDIAVLPSRREGFGLVVAEAMACGLPVVRTRSGGFEDQIVENVNGFGIDFNDAQALAGKIIILLNGEMRATMGLAALSRSRIFDAERMIQETISLYRATRTIPRVF